MSNQKKYSFATRILRRFVWVNIKIFQKLQHVLKLSLNKLYYHPRIQSSRHKKQLLRLLERHFKTNNAINPKLPIRILVIAQEAITQPKSSAFIRLVSPLTSSSIRDKVSLTLAEWPCEVDSRMTHCIVSRTALRSISEANDLISQLREKGIKLVVDTDDAFHSLDSNHTEYAQQLVKSDTLLTLIENSDLLWCSTTELKKYYMQYANNAHVVPNSVDHRLWRAGLAPQCSDEKIQLLYMGTATHHEDFAMILPSLKKLASSFPNSFELTVIGISPNKMDNEPWINRVYQPRGKAIYPEFVQWFSRQGPFDIGLCPLVNNNFNNSKSDIKCIDYIAVGALPFVSDLTPYHSEELSPYIVRCKSNDSWFRELSKVLEDIHKFRAAQASRRANAYNYIWHRRNSDKTATYLYEQLVELNRK